MLVVPGNPAPYTGSRETPRHVISSPEPRDVVTTSSRYYTYILHIYLILYIYGLSTATCLCLLILINALPPH
jgi:hypothetical protein